jgi:hypothetical protein
LSICLVSRSARCLSSADIPSSAAQRTIPAAAASPANTTENSVILVALFMAS